MNKRGLEKLLSAGSAKYGDDAAVHGPSSLWVDVFEHIDPQAGFWDRYLLA